jgi:hypothetical protein
MGWRIVGYLLVIIMQPIKRFIGHAITHEGTGTGYHEVTHKLYCTLEKCQWGKTENCRFCDQGIDEVIRS